MSKVCSTCFQSSPGNFCGNCGGKCGSPDQCGSCFASGEGNFCGECGGKRLCFLAKAAPAAGGAVVQSGVRPSEVFQKTKPPAIESVVEESLPMPVHTNDWQISLVNLPAVPGQALELIVGRNVVYRSEGTDCRVNHTFSTPTAGFGQSNEFHLKLPVVEFNFQRNFKMDDGKYIRFMADNNGKFTCRRQKWPF